MQPIVLTLSAEEVISSLEEKIDNTVKNQVAKKLQENITDKVLSAIKTTLGET